MRHIQWRPRLPDDTQPVHISSAETSPTRRLGAAVIPRARQLLATSVRRLRWTGLRWYLRLLYRAVGIEGVNAQLLRRTLDIADILEWFGANVGERAIVHGPLTIHNAEHDYSKLDVGARAHIGRDVFLDLSDRIKIGQQCVISMRAIILTHQDVGKRPLGAKLPKRKSAVVLAPGAYVGAGAIILPGVRVGARAVVGAGAVVTKDVAPATIVIGVPAREMVVRQ